MGEPTSKACGNVFGLQPKVGRNPYCEATLDGKCPRAVSLARSDGVHLEGEWSGGKKGFAHGMAPTYHFFFSACYRLLILLRHRYRSSERPSLI